MSCYASELPTMVGDVEAAMFRTLGTVLRRGSVNYGEIDALIAAAGDADVELGARHFAWNAAKWLMRECSHGLQVAGCNPQDLHRISTTIS